MFTLIQGAVCLLTFLLCPDPMVQAGACGWASGALMGKGIGELVVKHYGL